MRCLVFLASTDHKRSSVILLLLVAFLAQPGKAGAAIVDENFEGYLPTPFVVEDANGRHADKGTNFSDAWEVHNTQRAGVNVIGHSMTYSGNGFTIVGGNNALRLGPGLSSSTIDHLARRSVSSSLDSGDVWFSYLLETASGTAGTERDFFQVLFDDGTLSSEANTVSSVLDGGSGGHNFRARVGGSSNTIGSSVFNTPGTANFIVGRIVQNVSGDYDTIEIYANPSSLSQPATPSATATGALSEPVTSIDSVRFRTSVWESADEVYFDEFRLGNSYNDVLARYENRVRQDNPVFYARLNETAGSTVHDTMTGLEGDPKGDANLNAAGWAYGELESDNSAVGLDGDADYVSFADPGTDSLLDFGGGDEITLEAWIRPDQAPGKQFASIISKGRNLNGDLQNYALRLRIVDSETARLGFIYRNDAGNGWNIWDSSTTQTLALGDGQWHHLAMTYEFGDGGSMLMYLDGEQVTGAWHPSYGDGDEAPYQSDDPLWIGSQQGGGSNVSFPGLIDEAAIYRYILTPEQIRAHYRAAVPEPSAFVLLWLGGLGLLWRRR